MKHLFVYITYLLGFECVCRLHLDLYLIFLMLLHKLVIFNYELCNFCNMKEHYLGSLKFFVAFWMKETYKLI